ncbi:enoyl-CoA hydratase/isomerase family protein [Novosphingobium mathurense]|uniref:Enoyl-CoA hydratase/carnithine racemase n=1 Tax=Novosphingobium mathurense TaxID=428990 RepID=A0A1U6HL23_9SPHN|nr:enoyl-CoA hydratase/isomerase family protein [Novosphingobium mathurense]SLJ96453.1 Enoyl-CoA hydratase/carnithine racemase [Novosphingobium mathurense]
MSLHLFREGAVARIEIDRAERRNAFRQDMWARLPELVAQAASDSAVKVMVLTGSQPGMFCAGADISEMLDNRANPDWLAANQAAINRAQYELTRAPMPTIAFVDGDCIGGGLGLALACDMRLATRRARFGVTPAKLGIVYPLHDTRLLVDLVGPGQASRLLYTGGLLDAEEALRIGLIEELAESAHALAATIAANASYSLKGLKRMIRWARDGQIEDDKRALDLFAAAFTAPEFEERAAAFVARRRS